MKLIKYSGLAQSHALSPTAIRALIPTPCTRNFARSKLENNWPSSSIEQELYLAAFRWARVKKEENVRLEETGNKTCLCNQRKYVQKSQRNQGVEDIGRQLCQVIDTESSESDKKWNRSSIQGCLNLLPHCPSLLELWLQLSALENCMAKLKGRGGKRRGSSIEERLYLAASRWARARKEENTRLDEAGNRRCLCDQRKYVHQLQRSQRVEDAGRQPRQAIAKELSGNNKEWNRSSIPGWLNLMPHCPPPPPHH